MLIAGGVLNAVLVPQVVRAYRSANGQEYVDRLLTLVVVLLAGVTRGPDARGAAHRRDHRRRRRPRVRPRSPRAFAFWCLPQVFFYGVYTLLGQVLNARGNFGPYMWAPVVNNVVAIAGMLVFIVVFGRAVADDGRDDLAQWDAVADRGCSPGPRRSASSRRRAVLLVPLYRSGFRYRPRGDWRGAGLGTAGRVAGWTFARARRRAGRRRGRHGGSASAAAQVEAGARRRRAASAYTNAFTIFMLPHSLVTVSLLTALFTRLSDHAAARRRARRARRTSPPACARSRVFTLFAAAGVRRARASRSSGVVFPTSSAAEAGSIAPIIVAFMAGPGGARRLVAVPAGLLRVRGRQGAVPHPGRRWPAWSAVVALFGYAGPRPPSGGWPARRPAISASYVVGAVWGGAQVWRRLGGGLSRIIRLHVRAGLAAGVAAGLGWPVSRVFGDLDGRLVAR